MQNKKYYVVEAGVLPEVFIKVMEVKKLLNQGKYNRVNDAVKEVGISRSTYYKYKDSIFEFYENKTQILTLAMILDHISGVLSKILDVVAKANGNILTINQSIPQEDFAMVSMSIDTIALNQNPDELIDIIKNLPGVRKIQIIK
ncbi:MAG: amino acid-binding domain protein [Caloramator sp.]|jgi:chorismate mutase|uniref:Chorismate mutase n=1 Tax=Caloramator proteoclasticus DSM 10124 TaxID=1121262 RepID=A0A1M4ZXY4_9CLOT|nr:MULTISPECIES: ACT domain-containing protein [Caloramator]MBZ4664537.1 amino acid-binding domain protein [Caloramator sp.]SHF22899.1 chorismate mutase [Caloramator proteoclasticus DSM 10124]